MIKKITAFILSVLFIVANTIAVFPSTPFQGYTYNFWGTLVPSPAAYVPVRSFGLGDIRCGENCGLHFGENCELGTHVNLGEMSEPTEIHVDSAGNIYLVDAGNNRIVVFDIYLNLNRVIYGFYRDGEWDTFRRPHGVFVTDDMQIFIADNQNNRVVIIDEDAQFIREITAPQIDGFDGDFEFLPQHVLVDRGGRTFVIVQRVFEGIMSFNDEGEFIGYFGTINVSVSPIDIIWRMFFMTDRQIEVANRIIPREYQSMSMDQYGFVFTTHVETWHLNNQVKRLNPRGQDVLVNFNENVVINGDQGWRDTGPLSGMSVLVDVVARSHGRYSVLCDTRGRVYTYDSEGNLLYVFSGTGSMQGMTRMPVSIETIGEDILLLDADRRGRIIHFEPTEYGRLINRAIALRYDGYERYAVDYWRKVVALDENFALAWSGIGRSYLAMGYNATAMYYLERGMDVRYFSVAFRRNRLDVMQETLPSMMTGGMVVIVLLVGLNIFRKIKGKGGAVND